MKEMLRPQSCIQDKECMAKKAMKRIAEYCGAHSLMHTLSARSIGWMKRASSGITGGLGKPAVICSLEKCSFGLD